MTSLRAALTLLDAAVLAPVYRDTHGRLRLVMVLRSPHGVHGNQIGLPGGRPEPGDANLMETALREANEEIGLSRDLVDVLGPLPEVGITSTGFRIWPFLGKLRGQPPIWRRQEDEVAEVLDVAVDTLMDPNVSGQEVWHRPEWAEPRSIQFVRVGPYKLWGATHKIVMPLLPRLAAGEWDL